MKRVSRRKLIRTKIICVDFDGVIYTNFKYRGTTVLKGEPVPGAVEALAELSKIYKVVVNSSRFEDDGGMEAVRLWMRNNGMDYELSKYKPTAHVYIDDRAVCFNGNWQDALQLEYNIIRLFNQLYENSDKTEEC